MLVTGLTIIEWIHSAFNGKCCFTSTQIRSLKCINERRFWAELDFQIRLLKCYSWIPIGSPNLLYEKLIELINQSLSSEYAEWIGFFFFYFPPPPFYSGWLFYWSILNSSKQKHKTPSQFHRVTPNSMEETSRKREKPPWHRLLLCISFLPGHKHQLVWLQTNQPSGKALRRYFHPPPSRCTWNSAQTRTDTNPFFFFINISQQKK